MAVSYISALFHADDDNGAPLVGGKLWTYLNGTTTPAATYADAGGATLNPNPVILNSRGEASVFLTASTSYTFALLTSANAAVWTQDDITSALSASALSPYALKASPTFTGTPTAPTPTPGDSTTKLATTAFVSTAISTAVSGISGGIVPKDCVLSLSGGSLLLSRHDGTQLAINGTNQTIPSAGVTKAASGLANNTLYYIYAYMVSATMTLEVDTTTPATSSTTGIRTKSGDATRTLVGMVRTDGSGAFAYVRSWFNDPGYAVTNHFTTERDNANSTTYTEINSEIRCGFLCWSGEAVNLSANGVIRIDLNTGVMYTSLSIDGTAQDCMTAAQAWATNAQLPMSVSLPISTLGEGYHYASIIGKGNANTFSGHYAGAGTAGDRTTLNVSIGAH